MASPISNILGFIASLWRKNPTQADTILTVQPQEGLIPASAVPFFYLQRFQAEIDRIAVIRKVRVMYRTDPRVEKMHRVYARDTIRQGFAIKTENAEALQIANDLIARVKLQQRVEDFVRLSMRDGDSFLEVGVDDGLNIVKMTRKVSLMMHRNSNPVDEFDDPTQAYWMQNEMFTSLQPAPDALWFPEWQIIHARWNHDSENRYGTPMMQSAISAFNRVVEGELDVAVRRKVNAGQVRLHTIEGGSPADLEAYKTENKDAIDNAFAAVTNLFSNKKGSIETLVSDGNLDKIGDVKHHVETMFAAADVPMELIAYGSDMNRDILSVKQEEYESLLGQARDWTAAEIIVPLLERQWLLKGILPESVIYSISWKQTNGLTPQDVGVVVDTAMKMRVLGLKDEMILAFIQKYLPGASMADLSDMQDMGQSQRYADMLKGLSI